MASINSIKRVEIYPSNRATANNTWSYKEGNPTLVFNFGVQDTYLLSNTLKLNFTLRVLDAAGARPNNDGQNGAAASAILQNDKIGAMSCFQNITLSNALNQNLEYVRNYPRLLASLIPARANFEDYTTILGQQFGATSNKQAQGMVNNHDIQVSAPLLCGLFLMGEPIPLGMNGTGGLQIKLQMSPSIESNFAANAAGSYYQIVNPTLTCALGMPEGGQLPKIAGMPYLAYSNYYGVLNNGDETHNINCGLSSVLTTFSNFIPTTHIANNTEDGNATPDLRNAPYAAADTAPISRYTSLRGGLKFPYQFTVDERRNISTNALGAFVSNFEAQLARNFLSSISSPIKDLAQTLTGNISEATQAAPDATTAIQQNFNTAGENIIGVGSRYDQLGVGDGANFTNRSFSHRFQSGLNGVSPNSVYTFMLGKNMITFNDNGGIAVTN
tara:strand:- start:11603 stop:12931 length:1329 start_codon:yes stop_codon:yes gene_type:complete